ncbi:MAG: ABC transporter permease [Bacteroides sp.]|nr:ABC transporter permease [Bacteroides sp.]MCM1550796.1 ABC transporter permease [Clostridium sp.]
MKLNQALKMALASILTNKMRSFLTMLGIIVGVMAVTLLISIVQGATNSITEQLSSLGGGNLTCVVKKASPRLTLEEVTALEEEDCIGRVCASIQGDVTVKAAGNQYDAVLYGVTEHYMDINSIQIEQGRGILEMDNEYRLNICVLGVEVAKKLFGHTDVVGENVRINGLDYRIVGILKETGANNMDGTDTQVYIPFLNAQRLSGQSGVSSFSVSAASEEQLEEAESYVNDFLKDKFGKDGYMVMNMGSIVDMIKQIYDTLSYMLGGIAGISLLVGGIGIMNIMLVSVTERTREIGIRKAIGAQKADITVQFLIESVVLSMMGGLIGMMVSGGILGVVNLFATDYHFAITVPVALVAVLFSAGVGIIFGIYPANKAAKLKPIDALRFE